MLPIKFSNERGVLVLEDSRDGKRSEGGRASSDDSCWKDVGCERLLRNKSDWPPAFEVPKLDDMRPELSEPALEWFELGGVGRSCGEDDDEVAAASLSMYSLNELVEDDLVMPFCFSAESGSGNVSMPGNSGELRMSVGIWGGLWIYKLSSLESGSLSFNGTVMGVTDSRLGVSERRIELGAYRGPADDGLDKNAFCSKSSCMDRLFE